MPNLEDAINADMIAKDPETIELIQKMHSAGLRIKKEGTRSGREVRALKVLRLSFQLGILDSMLEVLNAKTGPWGNDPVAVKGKVLRGLLKFLSLKETRAKLDMGHLRVALSDPEYGSASGFLRSSAGSVDVPSSIATMIRDRYNKNLRGIKRIEHEFKRHDRMEK